jgi:hypothetical protein
MSSTGKGPARQGWFGFGPLAATLDRRCVRSRRSIGANQAVPEDVDVPHGLGSGGEIVSALLRLAFSAAEP